MNTPTVETSGLSCGQQSLWYLNQLEPHSTAYHLGICLELRGAADERALELAWKDVAMAHPQLRARFHLSGGEPAVEIDPAPAPLLVEKDGSGNLRAGWNEIAERPFDLEHEAPVRAHLVRGADGVSYLLLCSHHIVTDLWSSAIILREFSVRYQARIAGQVDSAIASERMTSVEFALAERHWLAGREGSVAWEFWRKHGTGTDFKPLLARCVADGKSGEIPVALGAGAEKLVRRVAREKGTTPYAVLLACYARLLGEETNRDELFIGTPAMLRNRAALRNTVGYFVNAVPIRCPAGTHGADSVSSVAGNASAALRHRRFPFSVLVERLGLPRTPGTTPMFQSMFAYQSLKRSDRDLLLLALRADGARWEFGGGLTARTMVMPAFDAQFPIALMLGPDGEGFSGSLQYDGRRLTAATAMRLAGRFPELIHDFLAVRKLRSNEIEHVRGERLEDLFDETVRRFPDAAAISEGEGQLTYAEAKVKADALAASLNAALPAGSLPVALQMPSCAEAAILILALLKCGRTFQPVDPGEPEARRNAALLQTAACALILPAGNDPGVLPAGVRPLDLGKLGTPSRLPNQPAAFSTSAYLVYTSGSTGEPKAVEVEHATVINHARAMARLFALTPQDRILQFHTLAFDAAFEEIFPSWLAGACVVFEPRARRLNVPAFLEAVKRDRVTVLNLPTSYWHTLTVEALQLERGFPPAVRLMVVGGEQAFPKAYAAWRKLAPDCRWINTYGPTEATITALAYEPPAGAVMRGAIPIGRAIDGVTALLLNKAGKPVRVGTGELLVGGKGLALGYRGDPKTTAAKFVIYEVNGESQRFYRTGDRVRLRRDGNFEYLGRFDRQLKIRGHRIDPDEIERAVRSHPAVRDAVVMPYEIKTELNLAGWILRADESLTERELRDHLSRRLPLHMIPTRFNFVARIPRKPSGKIDRGALADIRAAHTGRGPVSLPEVMALFSELIGHKIGPQDDFFLAGGHSLLAIKLLGRIETKFGPRLSLSDFLLAPTAKGVWKRIRSAPVPEVAEIPENIPPEMPVSAQQSRALLAHEIGRPSLANILLLLRVDGRLEENALARAVEIAARQNFIWRSTFVRRDAGVFMRAAMEPAKLERRSLSGRNLRSAALILAREEENKPFQLDGQTPWIRLLLATAPSGDVQHLILITHHAVADGWTLELLLADLRATYDRIRSGGNELSQPARDYRVHVLKQARWLNSTAAREQGSYWKKRLIGAEEARLSFRRPASPVTPWEIERHQLALSPQLSRDLRGVAAMYGTTPFALMMACFKALIHRQGGQRDITIGSVVSNRSTPADQDVFGPLQNPVLIRNEVTGNLSMRTLVRRVGRTLSGAQANGALPFEQVVREAWPHRSAVSEGGVQFLSQDGVPRGLKFGSASLRLIDTAAEKSPFELSIAVSAAAAARVKIKFEYQPAAYAAADIKCLARQYAALLQAVAEAPAARLAALNIIPADELRGFGRRISVIHSPQNELLHEGFEAQARKNPDSPAVIADERCLTYGELDSMAIATAQVLAKKGLKEKGLVAVMLSKGWEQIVACLAILKAGGCYVPLDPALPVARLKTIFRQGKFRAAIVGEKIPDDVSRAGFLPETITIYDQSEHADKLRHTQSKSDSTAYIIFTSGSTGIPKGVMVSHQAAMTTIAEINRRFKIRRGDRVFGVSALGFDLSVFDIFGTLRAGGAIVMPTSRDPKKWLRQIAAARVTVWNSVPGLFELLLDEAGTGGAKLETIRLVMLSGDFISPALAHRTRAGLSCARLISLGGATEGGIWSIAREVKTVDPAWQRIPYGRALARQEMFVLDEKLNHCPAGVMGELFIAGAGLATGYWRNRPETKRRFRLHPRYKVRLYQTGDKGRYLENGEIEILGRLDGQIKINGIRLEPGEIEAALCTHPSVRQALAEVHRDATGNKSLVAFVVAEAGTNRVTLMAHAKKILPVALVPSIYIILERFPLTLNGKIDRAALRAMNLPDRVKETAAAPDNPTELWIADLWRSLLGGISAGVEDDFFALGGHSLLAIKMLQRVRSHFAVDLPLSLIVEHPTVRGLAAAVKGAAAATETGLTKRATTELEGDSEPVMAETVHRTNQRPDAIFLTGATGHLGSALLAQLLQKTNDRIYCLIRSGSREEAQMRLHKILQALNLDPVLWQRVEAIPGDLARERFGLDATAFAGLAMAVRAVYHCAAEVNFVASYEKLAPGNVGGVREVIRLATAGGAVLHHVSSVAVFPYGGAQTRYEREDISKIKTLTGGYAQSKWVSERMVAKAAAQGLRAVIYRPAQIIGRAGNSPHDLFEHVLRVCNTLGAVPDIDARMDMVTAEYAAAAIHVLSKEPASAGKVFHLVHPEPVSLRDFAGLFPVPPPLIPLDAWLELLNREARQSDDPSLHFVALLIQGLGRTELTPPGFDCSETTLGLRGTGIFCPRLDRHFIQRELAPLEAGR